jgi:hypothetical protein
MSVYFITDRKAGMVKVGCAYDPYDRLKTLQCANPNKLKIEALLRGSHKRERELHTALKKYRVRGEWFRLCPETEAVIREIGRPSRVKMLAERNRLRDFNLDDMDEEPRSTRVTVAPMRIPPGFTYETLPPPRVSAGFDERRVSRDIRKRIASGDIIFPYSATEAA